MESIVWQKIVISLLPLRLGGGGPRRAAEHIDPPALCAVRGCAAGPLPAGRDVATALGYQSPQEAIRTHVDDEDKGVSEILTPGGKQPVPIINEPGLYRRGADKRPEICYHKNRKHSPGRAEIHRAGAKCLQGIAARGNRHFTKDKKPSYTVRVPGSSPYTHFLDGREAEYDAGAGERTLRRAPCKAASV